MYRLTVLGTALVLFALFVFLMLVGGTYATIYGFENDAGAGFMARRAAPIFLGLAIVVFALRNEPPSAVRDAMCYGVAATWFLIAATGVAEFVSGAASFSIVVAAVAEVALGIVMLIARTRD